VLNASSPPPIVLSEGIWPLEGDVMDGKAQVMRENKSRSANCRERRSNVQFMARKMTERRR
jgi:hypothetical protein